MSEQTFTHKDLAGRLGVSETTVKSYRRKFPGCIPVSSKGKPIRFTPEALAVATKIRDLFETGMSVDEVRARLAVEFDWISPETPRQPKTPVARGPGNGGEASPELSQGVSNMAKSMVAMTQQQKVILTRLQGLESLLEDLGLKDGAARGDLAAALSRKAEAARQREALLEERLDRLDEKAGQLAETVQGLAGQLERFFEQRGKAASQWREESRETMAAAARAAEQTEAPVSPPTPPTPPAQTTAPAAGLVPHAARGEETEHNGARVIPLRRESAPAPPAQSPSRAPGGAAPGFVTNQTPGTGSFAPAPEPPRAFFSLPLVARTEQGQYISAGGKSRGPFSLNDLKAMLIYGFTPPHHFTLRWEKHGQGWRLHLEQEKGGRRIRLLLMELPTQKGGSVVEILQITDDEDAVHPAEICGIIDSFGA